MAFENGLEKCTCIKRNCERHGNCVECLEHHRNSRYVPYCKKKKSKVKLHNTPLKSKEKVIDKNVR